MKHHHFPCEALNWTWTGQCYFKKLEGDAKWHRIQSVSHTLIFQVFFNITSVLEFVYSHFFTLYLICMWLLFIMPVIKLLFLTIVLPGDFVVARRAFWRETEMAILVARTNLPVWDFQKLASLVHHICHFLQNPGILWGGGLVPLGRFIYLYLNPGSYICIYFSFPHLHLTSDSYICI